LADHMIGIRAALEDSSSRNIFYDILPFGSQRFLFNEPRLKNTST